MTKQTDVTDEIERLVINRTDTTTVVIAAIDAAASGKLPVVRAARISRDARRNR